MHIHRLVGVMLIGSLLMPSLATAAKDDLDLIFEELETRRELPSGILRKICYAESRCISSARSNSSSAAGLFQWLDASWQYTTRLMHQDKAVCPNGCPFRLEHRFNRAIASEVTAYSLAQMKTKLGDLIQKSGADMTAGLYMAHFLGEGGARRFFTALIQNPQQSAASLFPKAAQANASIFRNRTLAGVYALMAQKLGQAPLTTNDKTRLRDSNGRLLVDNPALYASNIFDTKAVVPPMEDELDYQTNYSDWVPQTQSPVSQSQPSLNSVLSNTPINPTSYTPPPPYTAPLVSTGSDLSKYFNLATSSPTYISIKSGVDYFENLLGSSTRATTSPFVIQHSLTKQGTIQYQRVPVETKTEVNSEATPTVSNTFDSQIQYAPTKQAQVLNTIESLIQEVRVLLRKLIDLLV